MAKSQGQLTDVVTNTSSQLSSLAQTLETFIKAQTSSKDPQGINGGGTSSAPASPALYGNIIRSSNGVKTKIIEETQTAPVSMAALHAENMKPLEQVEETKEHFGIRGGYCGGIVDVYRPHLEGVGYYYDVNSLYPTAMCKTMPVGLPTLTELAPKDFLKGDFFGFLEAKVKAPVNEYIGLLPIKYKGRLICPGGTFSGLFFSEELRFALNNGYTLLEINMAWKFKRGDSTFKELITTLNEMKITAQLNKQPTIRNMAKLLMNSMYGRFGMHSSIQKNHIWTQENIENLSPLWELISQMDYGELSLVTIELNREKALEVLGSQALIAVLDKLRNNTNVALAAAVTAYSRVIINQYKLLAIKLGLNLYYSDTDSLVLNGKLPEEYLDSATLGKFKLEHTIKEGIFVMPKVYYLEDTDGQIVSKVKGFPGRLTKSQYLELLEGKALELEVTKWSRSLKETYVRILKQQPYILRFSFNKRQQVFENGRWVNTKPIIIS
jgi:DNA polymerase elongation subunit (family B)